MAEWTGIVGTVVGTFLGFSLTYLKEHFAKSKLRKDTASLLFHEIAHTAMFFVTIAPVINQTTKPVLRSDLLPFYIPKPMFSGSIAKDLSALDDDSRSHVIHFLMTAVDFHERFKAAAAPTAEPLPKPQLDGLRFMLKMVSGGACVTLERLCSGSLQEKGPDKTKPAWFIALKMAAEGRSDIRTNDLRAGPFKPLRIF